MTELPLADFIAQCRVRTDLALKHLLAPYDSGDHQLMDAMSYSLINGGKRVRPLLTFASAYACNSSTSNRALDTVACSIEAVHAYSLIHDDLPAMDDDDLRRGQPTCHRQFNEAVAILAGDALQTLAFECLSHEKQLSTECRLRLIQVLSNAAGAAGMVAGQAIDLAAVDQQLTLEQLQRMHNHKTGAIIKASVLMGAMSDGNASDEQLKNLEVYADAIGLAFQVQDDILDVTADTATLGKQQGADQARNKPTYVSLLGLEGAQEKAQGLHQQALNALSSFGPEANYLRLISAYIIERQH